MSRISPPLRASPIGLSTDVALHPMLDGPWTHHFAQLGDVRLHYVMAGQGPLIVLLHGFPDFWLGWRRQIPALAEAGFRVVAPDLRGYNLSDKPAGAAAYGTAALVNDVAALLEHLGHKSAILVGHDFGGVVAWSVARRRPELVQKLVVINAPHPRVYAELMRGSRQLLRSWYVFFFALPWLPEFVLRFRHAALIGRIFARDPVREGAYSSEEIAAYRDAAMRPGAMTAMLNYYRARVWSLIAPSWKKAIATIATAVREERGTLSRAGQITRPTLVIWGERDPYLDVRLLDGLERRVRHLTIHRIPNASHWVMADAPSEVTRRIAEFASAP